MPNEKACQRDRLIMEFGLLIQPFTELLNSEDLPNPSKYRMASAKTRSGDSSWRKTARSFATFADDLFMNNEFRKLSHVIERFLGEVESHIDHCDTHNKIHELKSQCTDALNRVKENFYSYLESIPVDWESEIFQANTPFTAYLCIRETLSVVKKRVHYFDRYLKADFFPLYLRDIPRDREIRLITTKGDKSYSVNNVIEVSKLVKKEFADYQLIQVNSDHLHDRNLRVDQQIFSLGTGLDRIGTSLSNFNPTDDSVSAHAGLDSIIEAGEVIHKSSD